MDESPQKIKPPSPLSGTLTDDNEAMSSPAPLALGTDYYLDEKGNFVFTEAYHLKRGVCCQNQCKHCPFTEK